MKNRVTLILLHGTRLTGAQWAPYAGLLADVADVVAPDLPAHGRRAAERFTLAAAVAAVVEAVERARAERPRQPVVLAGHSLGGYVAMAYAERCAASLAGLALMGCAAEPRGTGALLYRQFARACALAGPQRLRWLDARVLGRLADPRVWAAVSDRGTWYDGIGDAWSAVMGGCSARQLQVVSCPVLLMGGRLDPLHAQARRYAAAAPQAEVVTVPARSHLWPLTKPEEVATQLRRWLHARVLRLQPTAAPTPSGHQSASILRHQL